MKYYHHPEIGLSYDDIIAAVEEALASTDVSAWQASVLVNLAASVDADMTNAALWTQFRKALEEVLAADDEDSFTRALARWQTEASDS